MEDRAVKMEPEAPGQVGGQASDDLTSRGGNKEQGRIELESGFPAWRQEPVWRPTVCVWLVDWDLGNRDNLRQGSGGVGC